MDRVQSQDTRGPVADGRWGWSIMALRMVATVLATGAPSLRPLKKFSQNSTRPAPAMGRGVMTTWGTPFSASPAANDITSFNTEEAEALINTTGVWASFSVSANTEASTVVAPPEPSSMLMPWLSMAKPSRWTRW